MSGSCGKKDHGNAIIARFRERFSRLLRCFFKKSMWNLRHNADAIAGSAIGVLAGAVRELFDDLQRAVKRFERIEERRRELLEQREKIDRELIKF